MSNKQNIAVTFLKQYSEIISSTIKNNKVSYTTEPVSGKMGHQYYIDGKEAYISTIKITGSSRTEQPKFMLNIEIKTTDGKATYKCSGNNAKHIHEELYQKYKEAINRTRLRTNFHNPSFTRAQKVRG